MALLDAFRMTSYQRAITASLSTVDDDQVTASFAGDPSTFPIATPWSTAEFEKILYQDVFGIDGPPSGSRRAALEIPAVVRARTLLATTVARMPLRAMRGDEVLEHEQQPTWLYRTNRSNPRTRILWTVDDLLFYGWSCWWRENGADGFPLHVERLNMGTWTVTHDLKVEVNGQPVPDENVILITGYHEGILNIGREAISDAKQLYWIVRDRLANPVPMTELHQVSGGELNTTERDAMLAHWRLSRTAAGGGVGYTNKDIELKTHGGDGDATLLIEARNAAAVDMARLVGVSAGMLDATAPKASLNYETQTGRNQEFVDMDVSPYLFPIEDRLSLDDIVPAGTRIAADRGDVTAPTPSPTGPTLQD